MFTVCRRLLVVSLLLLMSSNFAAVCAGDLSTPTSLKATTPAEWEPSEHTSPASPLVSVEKGYELVLNVFFSPIDQHGKNTKASYARVFVAEDLAKDWGIICSSRSLTASQDNIVTFVKCCGGVNNFPEACRGDVFVKLVRRRVDGTWETDGTWNDAAPFVRLKWSSSPDEAKARLTRFMEAAFPSSPKALALTAERQKRTSTPTVTTSGTPIVTTAATNAGNGPQK